MKMTFRHRVAVLVGLLVVTIFVCLFSARFYAATNYSAIFEYCEEPITFQRLTDLALHGNRSSGNACINNLRQLDGAKMQWAMEKNKAPNETPSWKDILPYMGRGTTNGERPWCAWGGVYRLGPLSNAPTCSIPGHQLP